MGEAEDNQYFRPNLDSAKAIGKATALLRSRRYKHPEIAEPKLAYLPYWFFSFVIYETGGLKTKLIGNGFSALSAVSKEFDHDAARLAHANYIREKEIARNSGAQIIKPRVDGDEAKEILPVLLAARRGASKENVIVSGLFLAYVPFWEISAKAHGEEFELEMNAVSGKITDAGEIPHKPKTRKDLIEEALDDLSDPAEWLRYSGELVSDVARAFAGGNKGKVHAQGHYSGNGHSADAEVSASYNFREELASDPFARNLLLAIIAVLLVIWVFFLR